jgi:hypothetical protein
MANSIGESEQIKINRRVDGSQMSAFSNMSDTYEQSTRTKTQRNSAKVSAWVFFMNLAGNSSLYRYKRIALCMGQFTIQATN